MTKNLLIWFWYVDSSFIADSLRPIHTATFTPAYRNKYWEHRGAITPIKVLCEDIGAACPITHWGQVTHICVRKLTIIGSDNGLSPDRRQAIIWTNAGILLIRTLGTNFSEILSEVRAFSFKKMDLHCSNMACNTCPINSPKSLWSLCWIQSQYCTGGVYWVLSSKEIESYFHQLIGVHVIWGICSESLIFADESCAGRGGRVVKAMDC